MLSINATSACYFPQRFLILPKRNEFRMTQMFIWRPFREFNLSHQFRFQPYAVLHFGRRQPNTPPSTPCFRQIGERTFRDL
jgi:hypothetical protein